ncbi:hypothetical protein Y032_0051g2110 [Ancylostoma ceylanicum]|nr:hypothetical protein Y032_0051g2110 [Ancylostoma ceylanicum]
MENGPDAVHRKRPTKLFFCSAGWGWSSSSSRPGGRLGSLHRAVERRRTRRRRRALTGPHTMAHAPHRPGSTPNMPSSHRETDESSRDSGFGEMDYENMPTDFSSHSSLLLKKSSTFQFKNLDMEMDDLVIEESLQIQTTNMICSKSEELEVKDVLSNLRSLRKGLSDVTNSPRLPHAESPKSRKSFFAKPQMPRAASMYNNRKRCLHSNSLDHKRYRFDNVAEELENVPTCSASSTTTTTTTTTTRRTSLMLRVQSSSVLEVGHHHVPQFLEVKYHLETLTTNDSQAFRRIDARTLCQLMKSMSSEEFAKKYVLIDCRYPYEFNGGHIKGAINIYDTAKCEEVFFPSNSEHREEIHRRIPIFYCEYSQKRGPSMAQMLRSVDRQRNVDAYPKVDFPEIYVVDKGYRNFFEIFRESSDRHLCEPCSYVAMADIRFTHHLKRFNFHKKSWGNTTCSRSLPPQSRLALRQLSEGAYYSPSNPGPQRPSSRRPLFVAAPKTPEPQPHPAPLRPLHFS